MWLKMIKLYCKQINEIEKLKNKIIKSNISNKKELIDKCDNLLFESYKKIEYYISDYNDNI